MVAENRVEFTSFDIPSPDGGSWRERSRMGFLAMCHLPRSCFLPAHIAGEALRSAIAASRTCAAKRVRVQVLAGLMPVDGYCETTCTDMKRPCAPGTHACAHACASRASPGAGACSA